MKWLISKKVRAVNTSGATTETADGRNRVSAGRREEAGKRPEKWRNEAQMEDRGRSERLNLRDIKSHKNTMGEKQLTKTECLDGLAEWLHEPMRRWWGGPSHRFVGPVVLLKDFLGTILAAIGKHHYHLIAVGPRGAGLLGSRSRESGASSRDKGGRRQGREGRKKKGKKKGRSSQRGRDTHPQ